jgi:hypothetical protein
MYDDLASAAVALVLIAVGLYGSGLIWLVIDAWPYLLLVAIIGAAIAIAYVRNRRAQDTRAVRAIGSEAIVSHARQSERVLAESRRALERESAALEQARLTTRGELNFQLLAQRHHESRLTADSWYRHKQTAVEAKTRISSELGKLHASKRQLNGKRSKGRARLAAEAQAAIVQLNSGPSSLSEEIRRGSTAVTEYNQQTGRLRDHIRDNCGPRGQRWFDELEARKAAK